MSKELLKLSNEMIGITLNDDFSAVLQDIKTGTKWQMESTCYQEIGALSDMAVWNRRERCYMDRYPSNFRAVKNDDGSLEVSILDPLNDVRGKMRCTVSLDKEWIKFEVDRIDEQLPSLIFPPYIVSESLVVPTGIGHWYKQPISESQFIMPASSWNMRWFGGLKDDDGWIAIVDESYADSGVYLSQMTACAAWQKTLGKWDGKKTVKIGFTRNGYVGLAKRFRAYAKEAGLFKSLKDKIEETPQLKNLIGGRCVSFFQGYTFHKNNSRLWMSPISAEAEQKDGKFQKIISNKDVLTIVDEAKKAGMKQGYFNVRGWLKGGYDESHPDVWPPEPQLGSLDEVKAIMDQGGKFITTLHDNYQDIYTQAASFPQWVMKNSDGRLKAGGTWHGGQCYIVNSEKAMSYVKRNWENLKTLTMKGAFLDTIGAAHFLEDYSHEHPLTRTKDAEAKLSIARFYKSKGCIVGTEYGSDFSISDVDFVETRTNRIPGVTIPLLQLVYHDAVISLRYNSGTDDSVASNDTEDMLWGYAKMWPAGGLENWRSQLGQFEKSLRVDEWHEKIGLDEMMNHRYLNDEGTIEQTEFSSGKSIVANFSDKEETINGVSILPGGYAIFE